MCWSNYMATPIVLKKPLRVYKVGKSACLGDFISLNRNTMYIRYETNPTIKINPEFARYSPSMGPFLGALWIYDSFQIRKGYHSYLTEKKIAKHKSYGYAVGIFEIPAGATIYVNYRSGEVVSTDIKYLGLLK